MVTQIELRRWRAIILQGENREKSNIAIQILEKSSILDSPGLFYNLGTPILFLKTVCMMTMNGRGHSSSRLVVNSKPIVNRLFHEPINALFQTRI